MKNLVYCVHYFYAENSKNRTSTIIHKSRSTNCGILIALTPPNKEGHGPGGLECKNTKNNSRKKARENKRNIDN